MSKNRTDRKRQKYLAHLTAMDILQATIPVMPKEQQIVLEVRLQESSRV